MEGDVKKCHQLSGCFGKIKAYVSDIMGIIQCGSKEVLFVKKAVHFPQNMSCELKKYLSVGTLVNFNAEYLNEAGTLVATSVWCGSKPEVYISCSLSEYLIVNDMNDSITYSNSNKDPIELTKNMESNKTGESHLKYDVLPKYESLVKNGVKSGYLSTMLEDLFVTVDFHYDNFQPHVKLHSYSIANAIGKVVFYLSNCVGIMLCEIDNKLHYIFFSQNALKYSRSLRNIPLVSILPLNESCNIDIEVFVHNFKPEFFRVTAVRIDECKISHLLSLGHDVTVLNNELHSKFEPLIEQDHFQIIKEGFVQLKGVVSLISSNEGIIKYEILGNVCHTKFDKENVYHPQYYDFVLEDYLPVGTAVKFTALNCKVTDKSDIGLIAVAALVQVDNKSDRFKKPASNSSFTGRNETFFSLQKFNSGIIIGHTFDEVVIKCKIVSVNCMVCLHKSHPEICGKQNNSKFSECFPVGENVHFDAKVICCGEFLKVAISGLFLYKEKIGVASSVTSKTLTAAVHINEKQHSIDAKISHFVKSDYNRLDENKDDLTYFISVGDTVLVEVTKEADSSGYVKWAPYRVQRITTPDYVQNTIFPQAVQSDIDKNDTILPVRKCESKEKDTIAQCKNEYQSQSLLSKQKMSHFIADADVEVRQLSLKTIVNNSVQLEERENVSANSNGLPTVKQNMCKSEQLREKVQNIQKINKDITLGNEELFSEAYVHSVGEDDVSLMHDDSLLSFHCKNISLFGVSLLKYDLRDIFEIGGFLKFTLSCGRKKLCVGRDAENEDTEQLKTQLCQFCDERNIKDYIKSLLVCDFDSLYTS